LSSNRTVWPSTHPTQKVTIAEHDPSKDDSSDPAIPAIDNPSAHHPTSGPGISPGTRRHVGPQGEPGEPGNHPASPLATTPLLHDDDDEDAQK
jgi:hypothetical protein